MSTPIPAYPPTRSERRADKLPNRGWKPRHTVIIAIVALFALVALLGTVTHKPAAEPCKPTHSPTSTYIGEDSPLWDCHTMGNKVCGPGKG